MRSKISLTKLLRIAIALFEIPVSGWTCLSTIFHDIRRDQMQFARKSHTLVDVTGVSLPSNLLALLLFTISASCDGLRGFLCSFSSLGRLCGCFGSGGRRCLSGSRSRFRCHLVVFVGGEGQESEGRRERAWTTQIMPWGRINMGASIWQCLFVREISSFVD